MAPQGEEKGIRPGARLFAKSRLGALIELRAQLSSIGALADLPSVVRKDRAKSVARELEGEVKEFYRYLSSVRVSLESLLEAANKLGEAVSLKGGEIGKEVLKGRFPQAEWDSFEAQLRLESLPWYQKALWLQERLSALDGQIFLVGFGTFESRTNLEEKAVELYEEFLRLGDLGRFVEDLRRSLTLRGLVRKLDVQRERRELVPVERERDLKANFSRGTAYLLRAALVAGFLRGLLGHSKEVKLPLILDEVSVVDPKGLRILLDLLEEEGFWLLGTTHSLYFRPEGVGVVLIDQFREVPALYQAGKEESLERLEASL